MRKIITYSFSVFLTATFLLVIKHLFLSSNTELFSRVRNHFSIPITTRVTPEIVQLSILRELKTGSSLDEINTFIQQSKLGEQERSFCIYRPYKVLCTVQHDAKMFSLDISVITNYDIDFVLDAKNKLKEVRVTKMDATL